MTDLVLVHPAAPRSIYGDLASELCAVEPPVWCRIIGGYVRQAGFSVQIVDAEALGLSPHATAVAVKTADPRLVVVVAQGHQPSASTQVMPGALACAQAVRLRLPDVKIALAGGHPSALPERTLREDGCLDYVIVGEGPATIRALLDLDGARLPDVPGICYRYDGHDGKLTVRNDPSPLLDLKQYDHECWDILPLLHNYRAHNWQCFGGRPRSPYASIFTTLGCPWRCSFCCINAPFGTNQYRGRNPHSVVREIVALYRFQNCRTFKIADEMFVLNPNHYGTVCEGLAESGIADDLNIWAYARVDTVRSDKLALLRRAGIRWLALGIESASAYVRDGSRKNLKNSDVVGVVRAIQAAGINVLGNFIFGLPDDDESSMQATMELALDLRCEFANFYCAMAYPGSPLYDEAVREGWRLPDSWSGYSQHGYETRPLDTRHVSGERVLEFRDKAFRYYFKHPAYLEMLDKKFGSSAVDEVRAMTRHRLPRRLLGHPEPALAAAQ